MKRSLEMPVPDGQTDGTKFVGSLSALPGVQKLPEGKRKYIMTAMRDSYINMATDLQKSLSLGVSLLMYLKYLDHTNHKKEISVVRIGKLAQFLPHVITEREVTI